MSSRTYINKPLGDTEYMLEQWGNWRKDGMGVPRQATANTCPFQDSNYCITDDLAIAVDGAVARLTKREKQLGEFIWFYFGDKWPALRIGREHGMGEAKARELIKAGVGWIDCALENLRNAA